MKLKAGDAAKLADAAAVAAAKARTVKREKEQREAIVREKKKRAEFRADLRNRFAWAIEDSVKKGRRSALVIVVPSAQTPVGAEELLDKHGYRDIINSVVKEVESDGYKVGTLVKTHTWRTSHESNVPDYDVYEYQKMFEVKW